MGGNLRTVLVVLVGLACSGGSAEATNGPRLTAKFGFEITNEDAFTRPEEGWETIPGKTVAGVLPAEMPLWRSQDRFEAVAPGWQSAVLVDGKAVVLEQTYGKGTVVLASDTYFVSNEALHFGAEPDFLLWLLGGKTKIVFDETIHGTSETGGAMKLIRRYRAHGVFFGLIVFLVLWAWRSASPLVPGSEELERGLAAIGLEYVPSVANFILINVGDGGAVFDRLQRRGVIVRPVKSYGLPEWIRVTVGTAAQNDRFLAELQVSLAK